MIDKLVIFENFDNGRHIPFAPRPENEMVLLKGSLKKPEELGEFEFMIGQPVCISLEDFYTDHHLILPRLMQRKMKLMNFALIRFSCLFIPRRNTIIEYAQIKMTFSTGDKQINVSTLDIFPDRLTRKPDCPLDVYITPDLRFSISKPDRERSALFVTYPKIDFPSLQPITTGYSAQGNVVVWRFLPFKNREDKEEYIDGRYVQQLLLTWPKGSEKLTVSIQAEVEASKKGHHAWLFENLMQDEMHEDSFYICGDTNTPRSLSIFDAYDFDDLLSPPQVKDALAEYFDKNELITLLFELKVDHEHFSKGVKEIFIIEIIYFFLKANKYLELIEAICENRPRVDICE